MASIDGSSILHGPIITLDSRTISDPSRWDHPEPCRDCGRRHLNGEHITWTVPTRTPGEQRVVWSGCADCYLKRTDPTREI